MKQILVNFFGIFVFVYNILLLVRIVMSWIMVDLRGNKFSLVIFELTEPLLMPARKILPNSGPIDFSPLLVLFALQILQHLIAAMMG